MLPNRFFNCNKFMLLTVFKITPKISDKTKAHKILPINLRNK